jgi:hypothetical protein
MPSANHQRTNDQLAESRKVANQAGTVRGMAQTQPNITVCGRTFEKYAEDAECRIIQIHDPIGFRATDAEDSKKDVPEIEGELIA